MREEVSARVWNSVFAMGGGVFAVCRVCGFLFVYCGAVFVDFFPEW